LEWNQAARNGIVHLSVGELFLGQTGTQGKDEGNLPRVFLVGGDGKVRGRFNWGRGAEGG